MSSSVAQPSTTATRSGPQRLMRVVATGEAITWALLLAGMFLKYVTKTTELGVRIFGMAHGIMFVAFCVVVVVVAVDGRWGAGRTLIALASAVPPFFTLLFEWFADRGGWLRQSWRLTDQEPATVLERVAAPLIRRPARGLLVGLVAVAVLTAFALLMGPPAGS